MNNGNLSPERLRTISNQRSNINQKISSLRELQLDMINSLSKSPLVKVKRSSFKNLNQDLDNYSDYINKMNNRLNRYQINFSPEKFAEIENENDLGPNEKYMDREGMQLIKKIYSQNKLHMNKGFPSINEQSKLKVKIQEQEYPNPFQSLGVIKSNRFLYDEISKDYLYRQSDLFNRKIKDIQKYKSKFGTIKMPKIQVSESNNKGMFDIPVIDISDKKNKEHEGITHILPQNGRLKLFAYYKYPNKNFPEGREQFSLFMKGNDIIISGGITTNMKVLTIWGLNLEKLEWTKINTNGFSNNRYGHTGIFYQNKIYFFGGKTKYQKSSSTLGLEIFSLSDGQFSIPSAGKLNPEPRRNHVAELLGGQIFIYGGINNSNEILNDSFLLNLNPLKWVPTSISRFTPGPKVYGHSSCVVIPKDILTSHKFSIYSYPELEPGKANNLIKEKGIYIFGGKMKEEGGLSNQLWILITGKKTLEWVQPLTKGKTPTPRYFHSMSFYEKGNFLIIHGGRNDLMSESSALNDTYIFDLENFDWLKVELYSEIRGFKVLNRCGHQSVIYSNKLIIVGGMNNNNYLGSSLLIVNLDFSYQSNPKTIQEILLKQLKDKDDSESKQKLAKINLDLRKSNQLGVVNNISLPPIK
jgi:hypothetical protein